MAHSIWHPTAPTACPGLIVYATQVTVELKNDLAIKGTLHSVDQYLNIKLNNIRVVNEQKYPHLVRAGPGKLMPSPFSPCACLSHYKHSYRTAQLPSMRYC